jgi:hypothetical protein
MTAAYRTEEDNPGCSDCGQGMTWHVVGPDKVASSTSYEDEEDADHLTRELNRAYELGQAAGGPAAITWIKFAAESMPPHLARVLVWDAQLNIVAPMFVYESPEETLKQARKLEYSHWVLESVIQPPPVEAAPAENALHEAAAESPSPDPARQPVTCDPDWGDDIPFVWAALIPFAGLLAYATQTLFQV